VILDFRQKLAKGAEVGLALCHIYVQIWRESFWTEGHISVVVSGCKYIEEEQP